MVVVLNDTCSLRKLCNYLREIQVLALIAALLFELLITLPSRVFRKQSCISVVPELSAFTAENGLNAHCRNSK